MQYYLRITFMFLTFCCSFTQINAQSQLIIHFHDNTENASDIQNISKLIFPENKVKLDFSDGSTNEFLLSNIRKIVFNGTTRVNNVIENNDLQIYPNPATNYLYIKNLPAGSHKITIFNLTGIEVLSTEIAMNSPMDISSLNKGIYIILINAKALKFNKQ